MKPNQPNGNKQLPVAERIAYLIAGFLGNTLTKVEHDELDAWVVAKEENTRLFEELTDEANIEAGIDWHKQLDQQKALSKIKEGLGLRQKSKPFLRSLWPYLVAASLIIAVVSIYLFKLKNPKVDTPAQAQTNNKEVIKPGRDQAVLILSNGRTIILDSSGTGLLATEGEITVKKGSGGEIIYDGNDKQTRYNLVSTPRGGQYKLVLADGTIVWLNAESSLNFPAGFAADKREVELKGEGYFEVAKNDKKSFRVKVLTDTGEEESSVEVLGTHFNINSYGDEGMVKTTLLEGSVSVNRQGKEVILKPGQQAQIKNGIKVIAAEVEKEVAWKDGLFVFRDASIQTIGAQIARWYDVELEYKGNIAYHFNATIDRKEPLRNLLKLLEDTKRVHFKIDGKKLIIEP